MMEFKTVKHYNLELYVNDEVIEFGTYSFPYQVEKMELLDNRVIVTLPRTNLVNMLDREIGTKSLKWFESLYKKLDKVIMEVHS